MRIAGAIDDKFDAFWKEHLSQTDSAIEHRRHVGKIAASLAIAGVTIFGAEKVYAAFNEVPHFSEKTVQFVANDGDSIWTAANHVEGHDKVRDMNAIVNYIENMPENKAALSDGLQAHESIDIPESVKP